MVTPPVKKTSFDTRKEHEVPGVVGETEQQRAVDSFARLKSAQGDVSRLGGGLKGAPAETKGRKHTIQMCTMIKWQVRLESSDGVCARARACAHSVHLWK